MSMEARVTAKAQRWLDALKAKGHTPQEGEFFGEGPDTRTEAERLDSWVVNHGHCNGPGCSTCGWGTCWNCHDIDVIPECSERVAVL